MQGYIGMDDTLLALSFIGRLGPGNLRNDVLVESIKASLQGMDTEICDSRMVVQDGNMHENRATTSESGATNYMVKDTISKTTSQGGQSSATEVEILRHLLEKEAETEERKHLAQPGNKHLKMMELNLALRDLLVEARNDTAWCSYLSCAKQDEEWKMEWNGMPRLIALLVLGMAMEKFTAGKKSTFIPVMVNHIKRAFRYSFQSSESDLCVIEHPEWALNYIKDVILAYQSLFKRIKREVTNNPNELFSALIKNDTIAVNEEEDVKQRRYFEQLCIEFSHGSFFEQWLTSLLREARGFVYTRLPLLVYDYRTMVPDTKLSMQQMLNIANDMDLLTKIGVTQSFYEDDDQVNLLYNLLRSMTELATVARTVSNEAAFQLFSDFDKNIPIPCLKLDFEEEALTPRLQLDHHNNAVYGALDALVSLESKIAKSVINKLLYDGGLMENIRCDDSSNNRWYLQDVSYITKPMTVLFSLLKLYEQRCECLETSKARSEFAVKVILPIINGYLEYVKAKWNAEDDMFKSCTLTAFLIESTVSLHEFMIKYPYTVYMPQVMLSAEKVTQKMIHILGDFIWDVMEEPFATIHEKTLDVVTYLREKLVQIALLCTQKSYKQIVKVALEKIEKLLIGALIPEKVHQIILQRPEHVEMSLQNCNLICHEIKLTADNECAEGIHIIEDIQTLMSTDTDDLVDIVETINGSLRVNSIFKDSGAMIKSREHARVIDRTESTKKKRISIQTESVDAVLSRGGTADVLCMDYSDSDESMVDSNDDAVSPRVETVGEQLIIDKIRQKLKVQRLNVHQLYTLSLHILYATLERRKFEEIANS